MPVFPPGGAYFLSVGDTVFSPPTTAAMLTLQFISLPTFHLDLHSDMSLFKFSTADVAYFAKGIYIPIYLYLNRNYGI